jgi:hypothetical protein
LLDQRSALRITGGHTLNALEQSLRVSCAYATPLEALRRDRGGLRVLIEALGQRLLNLRISQGRLNAGSI